MAEVVHLPPKTEPAPPLLWVCLCGCCTFEFLSTGEMRCANCETISDPEVGAWDDFFEKGAQRDPNADPPFKDVNSNGSVDFARARMNEMAKRKDAALIVIGFTDGSISTWSCAETDEQVDWTKELLDQALQLIKAKAECLAG